VTFNSFLMSFLERGDIRNWKKESFRRTVSKRIVAKTFKPWTYCGLTPEDPSGPSAKLVGWMDGLLGFYGILSTQIAATSCLTRRVSCYPAS